MKRALLFALALGACNEEVAQNTDPLPLAPETLGYFCQMNLLEHEGPKGQVHLEGLPRRTIPSGATSFCRSQRSKFRTHGAPLQVWLVSSIQ